MWSNETSQNWQPCWEDEDSTKSDRKPLKNPNMAYYWTDRAGCWGGGMKPQQQTALTRVAEQSNSEKRQVIIIIWM